MEKTKIKLTFITDSFAEESFELLDVKPNITPEEIAEYGELIIRGNFFVPNKGLRYTSLKRASKIVTSEEMIIWFLDKKMFSQG